MSYIYPHKVKIGSAKLLFCVFLSLCITEISARNEVYTSRLSGAEIAANATLNRVGNLYPTGYTQTDVQDEQINSVVTLFVDYSLNPSSDFQTTVSVEISYEESNGIQSSVQKTLTAANQPNQPGSYKDRTSFVLRNGTVTSVSVLSAEGVNVSSALEIAIHVERVYKYNSSVPSVSTSAAPNNRDYAITWDSIKGAEEYQMEWLFVNNYDNQILPYDFENGATRITTTENNYTISSVFEKGYVLLRARAVFYADVNKRHQLLGPWSCGNNCKGVSAAGADIAKIEIDDAIHTSDSLNWQYIVNYAEGGKKKEVVSYYDGTMRSQQTVTRLNTDNDIVVGETYYDHQGRAAVQALPVPVSFEETDKSLRFYRNFNQNSNGDQYSRNDFDVTNGDSCAIQAGEMNTSSGSANYYSSENPNKSGYNAYIPDAFGYPFSQTEYEPDNTGRIRRQGGVGPTYQLGSGHETRYFYGKPAIEDLMRLFGSEVGEKSHYQKNLVVDANGQNSVSYLDMHGRIIATALAGRGDNSVMEALETNHENNLSERTINLLDDSPMPLGAISKTSVFPYLATTGGVGHNFSYSLEGIRFTPQGTLPDSVCLDCEYEITIDVKNSCGKSVELENGALPVTFTLGTLETLCGQTADTTITFTTKPLAQGNYTIHRTISLTAQSLTAQAERYLTNNKDFRTLKELIKEEFINAPLDLCKKPDCVGECLQALIQPTYMDIINCKLDCEYPNSCSMQKELLTSDFMPGQLSSDSTTRFTGEMNGFAAPEEQSMGGQYALYKIEKALDSESGDTIYSYVPADTFSIFNTNKLQEVYNQLGADFFIDRAGHIIEQYDIKSIIQNFRPEWADTLARRFHPERCRLEACLDSTNLKSTKYDYLMQMVDNYQEAHELGLLNPLGLTENDIGNDTDSDDYMNLLGLQVPLPPNDNNRDPFFSAEDAAREAMKNYMVRDTIHTQDGESDIILTMWQKAVIMSGVCSGPSDTTALAALANYMLTPYAKTDTCSIDKVWEFFRALYQDKKSKISKSVIPQGCGNVSEGKVKRFPDTEDLFPESQREVVNSGQVTSAEAEILRTQAEATISSSCKVQAEIQAERVLEQISSCATDSAQWSKGNPVYDSICTHFTRIMEYTCNANNISGSNAIPDSLWAIRPDSIIYQSFQDVMIHFIDSANFDLSCNPDLISSPREPDYIPTYATMKLLDTCSCNSLLQAEKEFYEKKSKNELPADIVNGKRYIEKEYGFTIDRYQSKICACKSVFESDGNTFDNWDTSAPWPEKSDSLLAVYNESVPKELSCEVCVDCEKVRLAMDALESINWFKLPHTVTGRLLFGRVARNDFENDELQIKEMIANRLNGMFHMNKNYWEYQDFIAKCYAADSTDIKFLDCGRINEEGKILQSDVLEKIASTTGLEGQSCDIDGHRLFKALNIDANPMCPATYNVVSVNKDSLVSNISSTSFSCQMVLEFVSSFDRGHYKFADIFHMENIRPAASPLSQEFMQEKNFQRTEAYNNEESFLIDAYLTYNNEVVKTVIAGKTCFPVSQCIARNEAFNLTLCPSDETGSQITPEEECYQMAYFNAIKNAEFIYESYRDSIITSFKDEFTKQCLANINNESFEMTYADNEYHYTLYYYDQAGNLVRTIPPAGVEFVPDTMFDKIRNNERVYTKHRLETRYLYNSLNQLVAQYMPDHEAFDIINSTNGKGLPDNLLVKSIEFLNNDRGVLFAVDPAVPTQTQVYMTYDGGKNWVPSNNVGLNNLNDIAIVNAQTIYICGDKGTLLRTTDGGETWTQINSGTTEDLVAIRMQDADTGYLFTLSGGVIKSINASSQAPLWERQAQGIPIE